ncbi:hypothetical protein CK203_024721 [Vitis vinifera]|uniref:DUF4283 domain-containing protein n=1 Tax=Vitis vinifera TaxID=29760 RepID=A0A438ITD9_VITVI|nr:hypothetical protein CK203_024721 [Vitis vinifera]
MKLFEKGRSIEAGKAGKDGPSSKRADWWNQLGGPACSRMPSSHRAKSPFKKVVLGRLKRRGDGLGHLGPIVLGAQHPQGQKSFKKWVWAALKRRGDGLGQLGPIDQKKLKGSAHVSVLGLPSSAWGEQGELPTKVYQGFLDAGGRRWVKIETPRRGRAIHQSRQLEETIEDPLETELPLCMVLKDGRSFSLPGNEGASCQEGGIGAVSLRSREVRKSNEKKRGTLSGSRKERELKKLVSTINYDGVAGRETEEGELGRQMTVGCQELGIGRNLGWVSLDARGAAGGVLVMWDKRVLEGLEFEVGSFSISCRFRNCESFVWVFSGLYGPSKGRERRELWEELAAIKGLWNDPWCIAGDFNVVRFPAETSNGRQMSTAMREFSSFIDEFELVDPPLGVELSLG